MARFGVPSNRYINADDIARQLLVERPDLLPEDREREAFRRARSLRQIYRDEGASFAFETVFSHPSTLLDMAKCRAAGFEVIVFFVTTDDPAINVARVARRVQSGGHAVPEDRIRQRYERTMTLLPRIIEDADRAYVYDNSKETPSLFSFVQGTVLPTSDRIPPFLRSRLVTPLGQREAERQAIYTTLGLTMRPEVEAGTYTGTVLWRSMHYSVQEVSEYKVLHDHLLLSGQALIGELSTITYREGDGSVMV